MKANKRIRVFLLLFGAVFCRPAMLPAQETYMSETFETFGFGECWNTAEGDWDYIRIVPTSLAGGTAPEAVMGYDGADLNRPVKGIVRVLTRPFTLNEGETYLSFSQYYQASASSTKRNFGLQVKTENGDWITLYSARKSGVALPSWINKQVVSVPVPDSLIGGSRLTFAFFIENSAGASETYSWFFDNLVLASYTGEASGLLSYIGLPYRIGDEYEADIAFTNTAVRAVDSCRFSYSVDGMAPVSCRQSFFTPVEMRTTTSFRFGIPAWKDLEGGRHEIACWLTRIDTFSVSEADTLRFKVTKVDASRQVFQRPLFEFFSSVNCTPCARVSQELNPVLETLDDSVTVVKLHTTVVGTDPYATAEGMERYHAYGFSGVPDLCGNGESWGSSGPLALGRLKTLLADRPVTFLRIGFDTAYIDDSDRVYARLRVESAADVDGLRCVVGVTERVADQQRGRNGETEFHHVLMSMRSYPETGEWPVRGDSVSVWEVMFDLSNTAMEEADDLELFCFIQEKNGKVLQSGKTGIFCGQPTPPVPPEEPDDTETESWAEAAEIRMYPNPAVSEVVLEGFSSAAITVYDLQGRPVWKQDKVRNRAVLVTDAWSAGTYAVRIVTARSTVVKKLVIR